MAYSVGLIVGEKTSEPFTITKVLTKEETTQHWCVNQGKNYPHDKAYEITLKCGKTYKTLNTQITKCIQRGWGWNKCRGCSGNKDCDMDAPLSHALSRVPNRTDIVNEGDVYGDLEAVGFAYNAKRHNYWEFVCTKCGATTFRIPTNVKDFNDCHCMACAEERYKGEKTIRELLEAFDVPFEKQYTFDDCCYQKVLPFDFAIFKPDTDDIIALIEYDGEQHFKFVPAWHGDEEGFELQKKRDKIKTDYCLFHHIPLIRIPYTEFDNIEEILRQHKIF